MTTPVTATSYPTPTYSMGAGQPHYSSSAPAASGSYEYPPAQASSAASATPYNNQAYYNSYGLSPSKAPPHPDQSVVTGALNGSFNPSQSQQPGGSPPSVIHTTTFVSAPAPTYEDVVAAFGPDASAPPPTASTTAPPPLVTSHFVVPVTSHFAVPPGSAKVLTTPSSSGVSDLLDNDPLSPSVMGAPNDFLTSTPPIPEYVDTASNDVSSDIIASQERALAQAKEWASRSREAGNAASTSGALTVPLQVPRSSNPSGSDAVHPNRPTWKKTRGNKTAAGATGGAIVGGILFGPAFPVGMVIGGAAGGYAANKISKTGERRAQREWEQAKFQQGATKSAAVLQEAPLV